MGLAWPGGWVGENLNPARVRDAVGSLFILFAKLGNEGKESGGVQDKAPLPHPSLFPLPSSPDSLHRLPFLTSHSAFCPHFPFLAVISASLPWPPLLGLPGPPRSSFSPLYPSNPFASELGPLPSHLPTQRQTRMSSDLVQDKGSQGCGSFGLGN